MTDWVIGPNDVLIYSESLAPWLAEGETVATATVTSGDLTISGVSHDGTSVTWTVSDGVLGSSAEVVIHFTTNAGEERDVTKTYRVINR